MRQMDGIFAGIATVAALIAVVVTFIMACASGNWGPFGDACACVLVFGILGASLGSKSPPARYCRRCGGMHPLPLGPNCRRR